MFTSSLINEDGTAQVAGMRRPRWKDPRLGVGVLLIAVSVALGGWVFAKADQTQPVYVASSDIGVGVALNDAPIELVDMHLGPLETEYLLAEDVKQVDTSGDAIFVDAVPAGELVPMRVIGAKDLLDKRPLSISVQNAVVSVGDLVDLWVVAEDVTGQNPQPPELVVEKLSVTKVDNDESLFATAAGMLVQVLVPEDDVGSVLGALGTKSHVTLVPHLSGTP